jgi:SAM-dependent methyltransferase
MDVRKRREQEFHDTSFSERTREEVHKFYSVAHSSNRFCEKALEFLCENKNVLEFGCGVGSYVFFLVRRGATVTGIDLSKVAIKQVKEQTQRERLENIRLSVMDAEALGFGNDTFDVICGSGILHHLDLSKACSELTRTLTSDGTAVFLEPLGHNPLITLYRRFTPHLRTEDEHPLQMKDIKVMATCFGRVDVHFFHLCSLLAVPFRRLPGFSYLLRGFDALDTVLFRVFPFIRRYAWMVVVILTRPQKIS